MFGESILLNVLLGIFIILSTMVTFLMCMDLVNYYKYAFLRVFSCKKKAQTVVVPQAIVTAAPITSNVTMSYIQEVYVV